MLLVLNLVLMTLNTAIFSVLICFFALIKFLLPIKKLQNQISMLCDTFLWCWASGNYWIISHTTSTKFIIEGNLSLKKDGWYLLIANHQSWADIVVLYSIFRNQIPMAKFFLKQQLLYVPFLGAACWALNMPFMRRYSHKYLIKHPEKRGADLAATRKSCEKFKHMPTTVVNFVEGTRFSESKRQQKPLFEYLLQPKTGGLSYTLDVMGKKFETLIDVTLAYPENRVSPFKDLLANKMKNVVIHIDTLALDEFHKEDYFSDKENKLAFQQWLNQRWKAKDMRLSKVYNKKAPAEARAISVR